MNVGGAGFLKRLFEGFNEYTHEQKKEVKRDKANNVKEGMKHPREYGKHCNGKCKSHKDIKYFK